MTNEERQKLVTDLRHCFRSSDLDPRLIYAAADEIERLAALVQGYERVLSGSSYPVTALAQTNTALVELEGKVHFWQGEAEKWMKTVQSIDRTPRPDASAEPVAWRWRWQHDPPNEWNFSVNGFREHNIIAEPLYTARPQPGSDREEMTLPTGVQSETEI